MFLLVSQPVSQSVRQPVHTNSSKPHISRCNVQSVKSNKRWSQNGPIRMQSIRCVCVCVSVVLSVMAVSRTASHLLSPLCSRILTLSCHRLSRPTKGPFFPQRFFKFPVPGITLISRTPSPYPRYK